MRLTELEPEFLRYAPRDGSIYFNHVLTLNEAQGIIFKCPLCWITNGGKVGTHSVICWSRSRGTPDDAEPLPGRWKMEGTGFEDLTLNGEEGGARSILLTGPGCGWHGFITNGEVT